MRSVLFTFVFALFAFGIHAQKAFKGGVVAGPVVTQISGDGLGGWDKLGFSAGAWVNMPVTEKMGIGITMKYINKGSKTKIDTITYNTFGYYLNYIDIPVLFTYNTAFRKMKVTASVGPYVGVLLNQKIKSNRANYDLGLAPFKSYDMGGQAAVAFWGGSNLFFELALSSSMIPTRPNPSVTNKFSYYEQGNYNQTLQFNIGLRFGKDAESPN